MIPVSAVSGQGIDDLRAALLASAGPSRDTSGYPRLAVDRAFTLSGAGLIVTGTLVSGRIAAEDRLVLSPSGLELRVRGLHAQNRPADRGRSPANVWRLNITGPRLSKDMVTRGDWVLHPDIHAPTAALDARITLLADAPRALATGHAGASAFGGSACDGTGLAAGSRAAGAGGGGADPADIATADWRSGAGPDRPARYRGDVARSAAGSCSTRFRHGAGGAPRSDWRNSTRSSARDPAHALRRLLAVAPGWTDRAGLHARPQRAASRPGGS